MTDSLTSYRLLGEAVYPLKDLVRLGAQEATVPLRDRDGKVGEVRQIFGISYIDFFSKYPTFYFYCSCRYILDICTFFCIASSHRLSFRKFCLLEHNVSVGKVHSVYSLKDRVLSSDPRINIIRQQRGLFHQTTLQ